MHFIITGVSHKTLPITWREKLYFKPEMVIGFLDTLKQDPQVAECLLLSTCNRTEMLLVLRESACIKRFQDSLCSAVGVAPDAIQESWYTFFGEQAVHHLFRVTSSLDSLVVGETQIFGQVRDAYHMAHEHAATSTVLNQLMHRSFAVSKRIRTETGLGMGATSLSSIAVELLNESLCTRHTPLLVVIGTGEMGKITAKTFTERELGKLIIINRTFAKAEELAKELKAEAQPWEELSSWLAKADAIVSSCSTDKPLLSTQELAPLMQTRPDHSITLVDLGVPRNIADDVKQVSGVRLFNVDDLEAIAARNQASREATAKQAEVIALDEASKVAHELLFSSASANIAQLQQRYEELRLRELGKTLQQLSHLTDADKKLIAACTESIVKKMLHDQIQQIREKDTHGKPSTISSSVLSK